MPRTESSSHLSVKLEKPPLKAGRNCHFRSTDGDTQVLSCGANHQKRGRNSAQIQQSVFASLPFVDKGPGCQSTGDGWEERRGRAVTAALQMKMLDVCQYLKREVENSVCGLAKIQNVLWGFAFSKIGRKSLIMYFQS